MLEKAWELKKTIQKWIKLKNNNWFQNLLVQNNEWKKIINIFKILKFEELETALTAEKAWMNSDSVVEKANIVQALKKRFKQQKNCNNQDDKFTNNNNQSNSQSNQNSRQNQHSVVFCDKNCERFNWFSNNWFNNISSITDEK